MSIVNKLVITERRANLSYIWQHRYRSYFLKRTFYLGQYSVGKNVSFILFCLEDIELELKFWISI